MKVSYGKKKDNKKGYNLLSEMPKAQDEPKAERMPRKTAVKKEVGK